MKRLEFNRITYASPAIEVTTIFTEKGIAVSNNDFNADGVDGNGSSIADKTENTYGTDIW